MSGMRIKPRFGDSAWERDDLADKLEQEGEWGIARDVRAGRCISVSDAWRAEDALDRQGLSRWADYREERCPDRERDGDW